MTTEQQISRPRVAWIDSARCLAMFFIMWLHVGQAPEWLGRPVGGGICLFFVMAGYFMPREPERAARRALLLGLSWLLWSLLTFGLYLLVWPSLQWSWAKVFGYGVAAYNAPLWFIRNLTIYQLIIALLAACRLLPRHNWLVLAVLAALSYTNEPAQHEGLRFDWMMVVMLGYCLRAVPLDKLSDWIGRNAIVLLVAVVLVLLQRELYPQWLKSEGISYYRCSLHVAQLGYAVLMCLGALGLSRLLPRINRLLAKAGSCMMFTYVAHSLLYSPIYHYDLPRENGWIYAVAGIVLLTGLYHLLAARFPRVMKFLTAR